MVDHPVVSASAEPADSPMRFCLDFAALLDARGISLRVAEARSGWGRTTIAAARKGPTLPNVELVVNVLAAIGEDEQTCDRWRARHQRLRAGASAEQPEPSTAVDEAVTPGPVVVEPMVDQVDGAVADHGGGDEEVGGEVAAAAPSTRRWSRGRVVAAVAIVAVVVVAAGVVTWLLTRSTAPPERTIVVQNKVAFGPSNLQEDDSPAYLAARPINRCANVPGCKLAGTDMGSGDTVDAVCQLQGATLTNADVRSTGIELNPNAAASSLWYGIRWPDGRRGYLSEVYVAPMYRGGLQLPPC